MSLRPLDSVRKVLDIECLATDDHNAMLNDLSWMLLSEGSQGRQDQLLQSKTIYIQNISNGFQDMITFRIKIDNNMKGVLLFYNIIKIISTKTVFVKTILQ